MPVQLKINHDELLKDQRVIDEIHRHLWIESEKAGYDRGFEWAQEDWLKRYAIEWVKYYIPDKLPSSTSFKVKDVRLKSGRR